MTQTLTLLTSTNEYNEKINIYPNPIIDKVTIKIDDYDLDEIYALEIYDALGRKVFKNKINSPFILDWNELKPGIYIFRILCNGVLIKTEKIMIK